ncbi:DUF2470 domain-containing protein [Actinomadura parmotrematis]|uniref:DUF2470 domain-containing protein n=1 Tax=Actinomadura parmotrematis TaxID=2864039 RepID=A0ABS7FSN8_9ACTN|nr:DUF2470 domain-containing protein [Actinomadura parmotrematis]MBW8483418.1 DUF2470 domain-containing protein [Actinomadura parmotrematis]
MTSDQNRDAPFTAEVVEAIARHMNDDHPADCLEIVQALGGRPDATAARMSGLDATGIAFTVTVPGGERAVRVPWAEPLTERAQVRREVVRMSAEARRALGRAPHPRH